MDARREFDAVVVGAGFSGMYMLHRLRSLGLSVRCYERAADVGGTWYWNAYPGARVDTHSVVYSYGFDDELQQDWHWSEKYAAQPELLAYANHVADRFRLRPDIQFDTVVVGAVFNEVAQRWRIRLDSGEEVEARYFIMAAGILSVPKPPDIPGLDEFEGEVYSTSAWPHHPVDLEGKRVGVVGTGSSGIQVVQTVAPIVDELVVFQRTPNFAVPGRNTPTTPESEARIKQSYPELRAAIRRRHDGQLAENLPINESVFSVTAGERESEFERRWDEGGFTILSTFNDLFTDPEANEFLADFFRRKIRDVVDDESTAELLTPRGHTIGSRRLMVELGYYETFNRDNVRLVDVGSDPITHVTGPGVATEKGHYDLDVLILATGFDGETGPLLAFDIAGVGGVTLREKWAAFPQTFLGVASAGFPNLFIVVGPGSPALLTNVFVSLEHHVDWISDLIGFMEHNGIATVSPRPDAEKNWVSRVISEADRTIFPKDLESKWMGANIEGKPRVFKVFVGGLHTYISLCDDIARRGYPEFEQVPRA